MITDDQRDESILILTKIDTLLNQFLMVDTLGKSKIKTKVTMSSVGSGVGSGSVGDSGISDSSGDSSGSTGSTGSTGSIPKVDAYPDITEINRIKTKIKDKLEEEIENLKYQIRNNI